MLSQNEIKLFSECINYPERMYQEINENLDLNLSHVEIERFAKGIIKSIHTTIDDSDTYYHLKNETTLSIELTIAKDDFRLVSVNWI